MGLPTEVRGCPQNHLGKEFIVHGCYKEDMNPIYGTTFARKEGRSRKGIQCPNSGLLHFPRLSLHLDDSRQLSNLFQLRFRKYRLLNRYSRFLDDYTQGPNRFWQSRT